MAIDVRNSVFEQFMGREVHARVEARGARTAVVKGRFVGVATTNGTSFVVLEDGRRLIRMLSIVDLRLAEDAVAESAALEAEGP